SRGPKIPGSTSTTPEKSVGSQIAPTPFGPYPLLRRDAPFPETRLLNTGAFANQTYGRSSSDAACRCCENTVNTSVVRTRRYLTGREVEKLMEAARKDGRYGHRDATKIKPARLVAGSRKAVANEESDLSLPPYFTRGRRPRFARKGWQPRACQRPSDVPAW